MTKFESRVQKVVRPELERIQQQILDQEVASDTGVNEFLSRLQRQMADLKDEIMCYFSSILPESSKKDKKKDPKASEAQKNVDSVLMHSVASEVGAMASTPKYGILRSMGNVLRNHANTLNRSLTQDVDPSLVEIAKRAMLIYIDDHARKAREASEKTLNKLYGIGGDIPTIKSDIENNAKDLATVMDCCSSNTQLIENVVLPAIYDINPSANLRNEISVIRSQLLDLRRLLQ